MDAVPIPFSEEQIALAKHYASIAPGPNGKVDARVASLVEALIGRVADKWTLLVIEVLMAHGTLRFGRIADRLPQISQKMLTQTLRHMEMDGLVERVVHPVVPPNVEYTLTTLGMTLSAAFCGVWVWARDNLEDVEAARRRFAERSGPPAHEPGRLTVKAGIKQT